MPCSRSPGRGVVSQHALQVSRPTPKGKVEGDLAWGGLQAHTQEVPALGACSRGVHARGGGDPSMTATAAGGTHPTGMHSC